MKADAFGLYNKKEKKMLHSGEYERYLGDSQPDARSKKLLNTEPLKIKLYAEQEEELED